ncbi:HPP family protein [Actinoplanes sp. N902-109]|uniref:HPP family protein n=1 Tax=Actinoplanes sp. (strain N902-109) TaxID=649831 RepID=UPI000687D210|nr:HPP family protein [Actinoplanes sp. N902-109]
MADRRRFAHAFLGSAVAVAVAGTVAALTHQPWLFPSLGPAVMLHLEKPRSPESSPRNTFIGHAVALLAGYAALRACGLTGHPSALQEGVTTPRIAAAAGSLAVTTLVLLLLKASHPPAGATTLIVSLGLLHTPAQLLVAAAAVVVVTAVDWAYNRVTGARMPWWSAAEPRPARDSG